MTDYQESQKVLSPLNSGPSICVDFQISSKLKPLQLLLKTVVTIKFTTLRNYGLIDDRCQYCQVSNLTGVKNPKKTIVTIEFTTLTLCRVQNFIKIEVFSSETMT